MDQNNEPPKIVFEDDEFQRPRSFQTPTPKIVEWVIKCSSGLIKDEQQANYVLIGFVAVAIIISLFIFSGSTGTQRTFTPENFTPITRPNGSG